MGADRRSLLTALEDRARRSLTRSLTHWHGLRLGDPEIADELSYRISEISWDLLCELADDDAALLALAHEQRALLNTPVVCAPGDEWSPADLLRRNLYDHLRALLRDAVDAHRRAIPPARASTRAPAIEPPRVHSIEAERLHRR
jgi:hypothetical protein